MALLKVIAGGSRNAGKRYVIDRDQMYIGRDPGNDIVIHDVGVTGYHARVIRTVHGHLLVEERTSTGIWVEEQRVSHVFLEHGTRFRLGSTAFVFDAEVSDTMLALPAAAAPPPAAPPPSLLATVPGLPSQMTPPPLDRAATDPAPPPVAPEPPPAAPEPPAPSLQVPAAADDMPAWTRSGDLDQLAPPTPEEGVTGHLCPGCEAPLIGLERFCAICGARTRAGGRRRVAWLKVIALLLVLGAGFFGLHALTGGDLSRTGLRHAITQVLGDNIPEWLKL